MFRPKAYDPIKENSIFDELSQYETDMETSSYSDENDTTNLSKIYHYETSEDQEQEKNPDKCKHNCCPEVNRELLVYKAFYFIFFGAVGALFPYLAVFYKQLSLSPHQVGILIGLRPFIQMCASPLWGVLADTYNVSKWILLMSIGAWLASNYSILLVKPKQYGPGCNLNLTYLPLTDDVDDQEFNWANIEPIVSKKTNISHFDSNKKNEHTNLGIQTFGKQFQSNEDYNNDRIIGHDYDGNIFFEDGGGDEHDLNQDGGRFSNKVEKNAHISLYSENKKTRNQRNKSDAENVEEIPKGRRKDKLAIRDYFNNQQTSSKEVRNQTILKILDKMFKSEIRKRKIRRSMQKHSKLNEKYFTKKTSRNWLANSNPLQEKQYRGRTAVAKQKKRKRDEKQRESEGNFDENDDFDKEESNEYLEDVLRDNQRGEFFTESILPNQRILAKESLKEEFDSLRSNEGIIMPIVNKADPFNSSEVGNFHQSAETKRIFNILLAITISGTILSSPAATLSDTATLQVLGDDKYLYGQQRLWGAIGWGLGAFIVGAIVSVIQDIESCADPKHIDYVLSFHVYAVAMGIAFIFALFFKFAPVSDTSYRESFWEAVKLFLDCQHLCFILTLLCAGASMGFTHTFLFWHLHDIGGNQLLFSVIAAVQCMSEVFMYFVSGYLILKIGCDSVLYIGLLANVLRLFTYPIITQPYFSIVLEVLQGISSASIWTAAVCYVGLNDGVQVTLQAMLHGIYWGLGHGGGGMLGGVVVSSLGSNASFIIFGICCIVNLAILLIMKYWQKLFELLSGYTSVETIPTGTYILVESQRSSIKN